MKRTVYDLQIFSNCINGILMDHLLFQLCYVGIIHLCSDHFVESGCFGILCRHRLHSRIICHCLDFIHDSFVMRRCDLRAIFPVYLITIVLRWIMAGCNVDSGNTSEFSDCIRKLRCRTKRIEYIGFDSVRSQTACRFLCKFR